MRAAFLAAVWTLAACAVDADPPGARRLADSRQSRGFSVSPDFAHAAWVEGHWPDRTRLTVLDLRTGAPRRRRLQGYSLLETAYDPAGALKVLARKVGASAHPRNPPPEAAILTFAADGRGEALATQEDPQGRIVERKPTPWREGAEPAGRYASLGPPDLLLRGPGRTVWIASLAPDGSGFAVESFDELDGRRLTHQAVPGPVESLLPLADALYLLTRSSDSLPSADGPGPRLLTKMDLKTGKPAWSAPWAPRRSELLARDSRATLYVAVLDPEAPSLWALDDRPDAVAAAGAAAAAPGAARARGLRTAGWFFARLLPALLIGALFFLFRR